jgi:nicotinate-nucleotide pyrophosphorylase (carboxylating)
VDAVDRDALVAAGRDAVARALAEDLGAADDVTSLATIPADVVGRALLVARQPGVLAGLDLVAEVYRQLADRRFEAGADPAATGSDVEVVLLATDGDRVAAGQTVAQVTGPMRTILTGERTALNLVCHLSGIATITRAYVDAVAGTDCVVRDTRKTVPGLRLLAKAAVRAGGGHNHRVGLSDGLLVKDNHVEVAGSITAATTAALAAAGDLPVQVEVDTLGQLDEAIDAGARDILLDNLDVATTRRAVARVRERASRDGRILLESSGTLRLEQVAEYAATGVDRVAIGAITHSAPQLDLGLDVHPLPQEE